MSIKKTKKKIAKCTIFAGGTGGHIFPAEVLAEYCISQNIQISFLTDTRYLNYRTNLNAVLSQDKAHVQVIRSSALGGRSIKAVANGLFEICHGTWQSLKHFAKFKPTAAIAFGGYTTLPPIIAAIILRIPLYLIETNSCIGKVNRIFLPFAKKIFVNIPMAEVEVNKKLLKNTHKIKKVGFLVNHNISSIAQYAVPHPKNTVNFFVMAGSQASKKFDDVIPLMVSMLPQYLKNNMRIYHQCRAGAEGAVHEKYKSFELHAVVANFFEDTHKMYELADIVISRSGAGSISEIITTARPSILIPYKHATDEHQLHNALYLENLDAAMIVEEEKNDHIMAEKIRDKVVWLFSDKINLKNMSDALRGLGKHDGAEEILSEIS